MLKIRLRRVGAKGQPLYRIVVAEARKPRTGAVVEVIGHYNPRTEPPQVVVNQEKVKLWIQRGAQPTDSMARLLGKLGLVEPPKMKVAATEKATTPEEKAPPSPESSSS